MNKYYEKYGQGPASPITDANGNVIDPINYNRMKLGFTNPNLQKRTDILDPPISPEVSPRDYELGIQGLDAYRLRKINYYNDTDNTNEIP